VVIAIPLRFGNKSTTFNVMNASNFTSNVFSTIAIMEFSIIEFSTTQSWIFFIVEFSTIEFTTIELKINFIGNYQMNLKFINEIVWQIRFHIHLTKHFDVL
jgi:hypothetical protein